MYVCIYRYIYIEREETYLALCLFLVAAERLSLALVFVGACAHVFGRVLELHYATRCALLRLLHSSELTLESAMQWSLNRALMEP
jgi:hypothetical protein